MLILISFQNIFIHDYGRRALRKVEKRIRAYISELKFNNGDILPIAENDIVIFVGPNNVGKSQALKDIYKKCANDCPTIVITDVKTVKGKSQLLPFLSSLSSASDDGHYLYYDINGQNVNYHKNSGEQNFQNDYNYGQYRNLFVSQLTTEARLGICWPAPSINRNETWTNPIHYASFDYKYGKWLSDNFHKAFGDDVTTNYLHGATIPLCIGKEIQLNGSYDNEIQRIDEFAKILESYKQVDAQGDGIKSFTGILLYLMLDYYCTYLIDEPESFLHPPQAKIMGQIIGETLKSNQQAFISTHSEEFIKGLLDVCEDRLKIVRIMRSGDANSFSILVNQKIKSVFGDPLLKHSNIMSSLFHKTVVLCESDSDCKFYSVIENHLKQTEDKYSETLFIHCGGKHRMARVADALRALNVDIRLIPDIDVLNDENIIMGIAKVFGIAWDKIKTDYNTFVSNLHSPKEKITRANAKNDINRILDAAKASVLTQNEIKQIKEVIKTESKWDSVKHGGRHAIPAGDATIAFNRLDCEFRKHGIFLVPVGEMECFVKEVGGHGSEWVNEVFEKYSDLDNPVYQQAKKFIRSIEL